MLKNKIKLKKKMEKTIPKSNKNNKIKIKVLLR